VSAPPLSCLQRVRVAPCPRCYSQLLYDEDDGDCDGDDDSGDLATSTRRKQRQRRQQQQHQRDKDSAGSAVHFALPPAHRPRLILLGRGGGRSSSGSGWRRSGGRRRNGDSDKRPEARDKAHSARRLPAPLWPPLSGRLSGGSPAHSMHALGLVLGGGVACHRAGASLTGRRAGRLLMANILRRYGIVPETCADRSSSGGGGASNDNNNNNN
jgi:hypothetical protein